MWVVVFFVLFFWLYFFGGFLSWYFYRVSSMFGAQAWNIFGFLGDCLDDFCSGSWLRQIQVFG